MSAVLFVTATAAATGARAAAFALACAGSEPDRPGLMVDLGDGRSPRPSLLATAAARALEERLAAYLPGAGVASRGQICQLSLPAGPGAIEPLECALALRRDSVGVVHLPPAFLQPALEEGQTRPSAALLRADLGTDRALTALAVRELMDRGLRVAVLKHPLGWLAARRALAGLLPLDAGVLPSRLCERLLSVEGLGEAPDANRRSLQRVALGPG